MLVCIKCKSLLEEGNNLCLICGANQASKSIPEQKSSSTLLKVLCVFTIVGSFFTIGRAQLYEAIASAFDNEEYIRGWIYGLSSVVTLIGAILMMNKKRIGLITYTIGQTVYIITVVWATIIYANAGHGIGQISIIISIMFMVPSIIFLWIYWIESIRCQFS